jgi:hypothetical protein
MRFERRRAARGCTVTGLALPLRPDSDCGSEHCHSANAAGSACRPRLGQERSSMRSEQVIVDGAVSAFLPSNQASKYWRKVVRTTLWPQKFLMQWIQNRLCLSQTPVCPGSLFVLIRESLRFLVCFFRRDSTLSTSLIPETRGKISRI